MATTLKRDDKAKWGSSQGTVRGKVEKKLTTATDIEGHHVAASKDNPEYLVRSAKECRHESSRRTTLGSRFRGNDDRCRPGEGRDPIVITTLGAAQACASRPTIGPRPSPG